jgi:hypothetical protein
MSYIILCAIYSLYYYYNYYRKFDSRYKCFRLIFNRTLFKKYIYIYIKERKQNNKFNNRGYDTFEYQVKLINWRRCERWQGGAIVKEK